MAIAPPLSTNGSQVYGENWASFYIIGTQIASTAGRGKKATNGSNCFSPNPKCSSSIRNLINFAELSIETKLFTDVSLAQGALSGARFVAVVVDCDLAGADSR
jgi:hypothetical protein